MFRMCSAIAAGSVLVLSALPAQAFDRLSETQFRSQVVGKTLVYKRGGTLTFTASGAITGAFSGGAASGSWSWEGGFVCSRTRVGGTAYPRTCRYPEMQGSDIHFVQANGKIFGEATVQ